MPEQASNVPALRIVPEFHYTIKARFSDWYAGRTDGQHREPAMDADDPRTAHWRSLDDEKRKLALNERRSHEKIVGDLHSELRDWEIGRTAIEQEIHRLHDQIAERDGRLTTIEQALANASVPTSASDAERMAHWRMTGGLRKRLAEEQKERAALQAKLEDAERRHTAACREIATIEASIDTQTAMFTAWLGECVEYFRLRVNRYVKRLVKSHPQGHIIGPLCVRYMERNTPLSEEE